MFRNHLKTALRNLRRQFSYTLINVGGLAVGMASCLLIGLYVSHELSYDNFHEKRGQLYRVIHEHRRGENLPAPAPNEFRAWGSARLGPALQADFPEVLEAVRFTGRHTLLLSRGEQTFQEERYLYADSTALQVFSFPLLQGDPASALQEPFKIVLSQSVSQKYFGDEDPVGQTMLSGNEQPLTVTGVMADPPNNSHLDFDILLSMGTVKKRWPDYMFSNWFYIDFFTYVLLPEGYAIEDLEAKMPAFIERHLGEQLADSPQTYHIAFEPIESAYLSPVRGFLPGRSGNVANLYIFSAVAMFILLIACLNFMNLATARSTERAKEVGMRKVVGAQRRSLVKQFLLESILLTLIAMSFAFIIAQLALPFFGVLSGQFLATDSLLDPALIAGSIVVAIVVGSLAGTYPALVLSSFRPILVLKGVFRSSAHGAILRKGLVVLQFGISVALIAGTSVIFSQLSYMQNQRLGFAKEQMLILDFGGDQSVGQQIDAVKEAYLQHPAVSSVCAPRSVPGSYFPRATTRIENAEGQIQAEVFHIFEIDYDFIPHFGLEMAAGRAYSRDFQSDLQEALVINEAAARKLGYAIPADAIGKPFRQWGREGQIIGVARDFNFVSLHSTIEPLSLSLFPQSARFLALRIETDNLQKSISDFEQLWQGFAPHRPFLYHFLDDAFDQQYRSEARFGRLFGVFAGLAILIACLGLFGLAAFMAVQRTKEIGVRKVLGASVSSIVVLLSKEFARLVLIAFVLAAPAIYFAMNKWLEGFAYRTTIGAETFLMAGLTALIIALFSVSYQSIRAAVANPVESLHYE